MATKRAARLTERVIGNMVDRLGALRAEAAANESEQDAIRDTLISLGREAFTGRAYDATVSKSTVVEVNVKKLRAKMPPEALAPYMRKRKQVTLRVTSRVRRRRKRR